MQPLAKYGIKSIHHKRDELQIELFKIELSRIVDTSHEKEKLADTIDWKNLDRSFAQLWQAKGLPAIDTRVMVSLHST